VAAGTGTSAAASLALLMYRSQLLRPRQRMWGQKVFLRKLAFPQTFYFVGLEVVDFRLPLFTWQER
jgi:hypothetical protein